MRLFTDSSRLRDYLLLTALLAGFGIGGLVTLNCTQAVFDTSYVIKDQEHKDDYGGYSFTDADGKADKNEAIQLPYNIEETNGSTSKLEWKCEYPTVSGFEERTFQDKDIDVVNPARLGLDGYTLVCHGYEVGTNKLRTRAMIPVIYRSGSSQ
jgi:hypothetical protein